MSSRTKLNDRKMPSYTKGEEIFNMVTHIVGGGFGVIALVVTVILALMKKDIWAIVGSAIYRLSMIALYTMSSIYHGLKSGTAKKVMQIMDHCTIFFLIAGTYTPILLTAIRKHSPICAWTIFGIVWGFAALGIVLNAIDLKNYSKFSMVCYLGMGWCIIIAAKVMFEAVSLTGIFYLLAGGIAYTIGAILYGIGVKHKYMHSVFHIFVVLGSILQFISIAFYII
jgi:hemolysin III